MSAPLEALPPRGLRLAQALPVLAALNLHGLTHGRYLLVGPVAALALWGLWRGWRPRFGEGRIALAVMVGAGLGLLYGWVSPSPQGPVPAFLLAPMCGALVPVAAFSLLAGRLLYGWLFAWLLVALTCWVNPLPTGAAASLLAVALSTLGAASLAQWDGVRRGGVRWVALGVLAAAVGGGTFGIGQGLFAAQGSLVYLVGGAIEQIVEKFRGSLDFSLPSSLYVGASGRVPDSRRALFEVGGDIPSYLRGAVHDRFDGTQWTTSPETEAARPDLNALSAPQRSAQAEMTFLVNLGGRLPAPAGVRAVRGASADARGGWILRSGDVRGLTVELQGDADRALPAEERPGPSVSELPEKLRDALRPLAEEIVAGAAATPRGRAEAIERFFNTQFRYSLSANLAGREPPLVVLIKERRPAHCTYFASAMAALMRSLDVPARLVGGFALEGPNPLTGRTIVRERDAHAWVEVWVEDEGRYVAFDPTPGGSRSEALGLERGWLGALLEVAGQWLNVLILDLRRSPLEVLRRLFTSPVLWGPVALVALWRVLARVRIKRKPGRRRGALAGGDAALGELYRRYLRLLRRRAGIEAAAPETDDALIERLREARGEAAGAAAARFLDGYRVARYRREPWSAQELEAALARVESAIGSVRMSR
ncbi:MAG: transglutaminase domain-containing protein [Deltaproteobacteria bacterium]|nr:transglutaminase domain-containing protein [Deltaproteobacteria bacterium]